MTNLYIKSINPLRKLGAIENRMALFHANLNGSTQGTQVIHFTANISSEMYVTAAHKLFEEYSALQCSIKPVDDCLWFCRDTLFADVLIQHLQVGSLTKLDAIIERAVDEPIDAAQSLWKLLLIREVASNKNILLFTAHHSIIDANGMHELANSFFKIISKLVAGNEYDVSECCELPAAIDDFLDEKPQQPTLSKRASAASLSCRAYDMSCPVDFRKTGWHVVTLEKPVVNAFNSVLKVDNLKSHSVITAAFCLAMGAAGVVAPNFSFATAVSLRFLQNSNLANINPLGCYMSIAATEINSDNENLVTLARKYERDLLHKIMTGCFNKAEINQAEFNVATRKLATLQNFSQGAGITNMGIVGIKTDYPDVQVTDYMMLANRIAANFSIVAHCYEFNGRQHISLVYPRPCLSDTVVAQVALALNNILLDYTLSKDNHNVVEELTASYL